MPINDEDIKTLVLNSSDKDMPQGFWLTRYHDHNGGWQCIRVEIHGGPTKLFSANSGSAYGRGYPWHVPFDLGKEAEEKVHKLIARIAQATRERIASEKADAIAMLDRL
ncbi:hypothetical protein [Frigidibacter oleivorans]|uniref:hypothetical protein n=1 Tax=Frigidibacter oleivorans TaxID=2487129 RepID=UPI000F8F66CF|nr:hypothetical protein [Frigidibacter oleivorans]